MFWGKTKNGKDCPFDADTGVSHFGTCPDAKQWTRRK